MHPTAIRLAHLDDLNALVALENRCFEHDRLSTRSFRYFLTKSQAEIWVVGAPIKAYGLVLFHRGTSLARIYSLAVHPEARGQGLARRLVTAMERSAVEHDILFIRLEVADDNHGALNLYRALGYETIRRLQRYYDDGHDGLRMEKRLQLDRPKPPNLPYYAQTTDFTCGPAALLMAAKKLNPVQPFNQIEELNIWREATTVFMTTGHGGCSPFGLALAAQKRGYRAHLWVSNTEVPFIDSVRSSKKKAVIELIHRDFVERAQQAQLDIAPFPRDIQAVRKTLREGQQVILLISTYRLNRSKEPHWIWLVDMDEHYAYFNDPDVDSYEWKTPFDSLYVPVPLSDFARMMKYGRTQYRAAILLSRDV
jgi:ribosomal protein S18 acetylase RimI-like enzyme